MYFKLYKIPLPGLDSGLANILPINLQHNIGVQLQNAQLCSEPFILNGLYSTKKGV
jgi:hypothetical protein